jgi:cytochrome c biogenesis protein
MNRLLAAIASLKLTLPGMGLLLIGVLVSYRAGVASAWWVAGPLVLLAVNLASAIAVQPRFRRQPPLLAFHLALLAVLVLGAMERLSYFHGRVELLVGEAFDAASVQMQARGPWYRHDRLQRVSFVQGDFSVAYASSLTRGETRSRVFLPERPATPVVVGDTRPLSLSGFHFYTTSNKGYAAMLTWVGGDAVARRGAVHFPSYPLKDWKQVNGWTTPAGSDVVLELALPRATPDDREWLLESRRAADLESTLTARWDNQRVSVRAGDWIALPGGRVRFDGLRMWMGYHVSFNPFLPWLLAAGLVGIAGLSWHFWRRLWSRPLSTEKAPFETEGARDARMARS